jgi:hypothetical protein
MKNIGTPIGTVMAIACATEPVSTPRRAAALLKANVAAARRPNNPPSTGAGLPARSGDEATWFSRPDSY